MEQKQRNGDVLIQYRAIFHNNETAFLLGFITMDGTWVYHVTSETKKQSKQWPEKWDSALRKVKAGSFLG